MTIQIILKSIPEIISNFYAWNWKILKIFVRFLLCCCIHFVNKHHFWYAMSDIPRLHATEDEVFALFLYIFRHLSFLLVYASKFPIHWIYLPEFMHSSIFCLFLFHCHVINERKDENWWRIWNETVWQKSKNPIQCIRRICYKNPYIHKTLSNYIYYNE